MAAVPSFPFIIDITSPTKDAALFSFDARTTIPTPLFVRNDGTPAALRLVTPNQTGSRAYDDFDPSTYDVALAIGEADKYPTAGSWQLTSGANTTAALAATISAADLQTALNALAGVSVTVSSLAAGTFAVTFTALGAQTLLTSPTNSLAPTSAVIVSQVLAGSASTYEIQVIRLALVPYALNTTWTPFAVAAATVDTLVAGDVAVYQQDRITLNPTPYDGTFTINGSTAIPYNAAAAAVQAALAVEDPDVAVTGVAGGPWTITRGVYGSYARSVDVSGLTVPLGLNGILNLSTYSMLQRFLQTTDNILTLVLECQLTSTVPGSKPVTVLQIPVRVSRDVIDFDSLLPSPLPDYYTAAEVDSRLALKLAIAANLSDVEDPEEAFGNIKQPATSSATGVVELATPAEVITGTSTTLAVTPEGDKAALDARLTALIEREGVRLYGDEAMGSLQIKGEIGTQGTADWSFVFGFHFKTQINGAPRILGTASSNDFELFIESGTNLSFYDGVNIYVPSPTVTFTDGEKCVLVVWRSGNILYASKNGGTASSVALTSSLGSPCAIGSRTLTNTLVGVVARPSFWNYALTNTEIQALMNRGLVTLPENRHGSMTSVVQASRSFSYGASDANNITDIAVDAVTASAVAGARTSGAGAYFTRFAQDATTAGRSGIIGVSAGVNFGQKARVSFWYRSTTGVTGQIGPRLLVPYGGQAVGLSLISPTGTWQLFSEEVTATLPAASWLVFTWVSNGGSVGDSIDIDDVLILPLGTLFEMDSGQRNAGYIVRDTSGNGRHVELPASGVDIIDPAAEGYLEPYTRTSDGYYVGDRVIIPTGFVLAELWATGDGTASIGESAGTPANVAALVTLTSTPQRLVLLVAVTSNGKLYIDLTTATTATLWGRIKQK